MPVPKSQVGQAMSSADAFILVYGTDDLPLGMSLNKLTDYLIGAANRYITALDL